MTPWLLSAPETEQSAVTAMLELAPHGVASEEAVYLAWEALRGTCVFRLEPPVPLATLALVVTVLTHEERGLSSVAVREFPRLAWHDAPHHAALEDLLRKMLASLAEGSVPPSLSEIVGGPDGNAPLVLAHGKLGTRRAFAVDHALFALVRLQAERGGRHPRDVVLRALEGESLLSDEQASAVAQCLTAPLSILNGGPGTGKSTTLSALVRTFHALRPSDSIAVVAPTGKAASRLHPLLEREGIDVLTVHRLLEASPLRFRRDSESPVRQKLVVVDEASMLDSRTALGLFRALPDGAQVVLVGDDEQLPSVEPGELFGVLSQGVRDIPVATLTRSFRTEREGESVHALSTNIAKGVVSEPARLVHDPRHLQWKGVEWTTLDLKTLLRTWFSSWMPKGAGFVPFRCEVQEREGHLVPHHEHPIGDLLGLFAEQKILAVTRAGGPQSCDGLNRALLSLHAAWLGEAFGGREVEPDAFVPVMVRENDHDRGLFNGDQGVIVPAVLAGEPIRAVCFRTRQGLTLFPYASVERILEPAYALTVHKSQGSECLHVTLVLPTRPIPLLNRKLLYTAVTRAKRGVLIVGEPGMFLEGVSRRLLRTGFLADLFAEPNGLP